MRQLTICQQGSGAKFLCHLAQSATLLGKTLVPPICKTIGKRTALIDYLTTIIHLAEKPLPLGHREVPSSRQKQEELDEALRIVSEPEPIDPHRTRQLALW
jgi:hypothetical protein